MIVRKNCLICGKDAETEVDDEKFRKWRAGEHVQNVWPEMPADQREMLMTGTHPICWKKMWRKGGEG